jgi:branched-chain amino acid transport system substrate-binding protein
MRRVICFAFLAALLAGCNRTGQGEPIFIGHLASLQNSEKASFEHARQGMSLAIEELGRPQGKAAGRQIIVLHVNADEDLEQLQASAVRLLTVNRAVALIGGQDTTQVERLTRAAQPYEAALVTPIMIAPYLTTDNLFSLEPSPVRVAKAVGRWLKETAKQETMAFVFDSRSRVASDLGAALRAESQRGEGSRLVEMPFAASPKFGELAQAILQSKAGAWFFYGKSSDWSELRRALREAKAKLPCLLCDSVGPVESLPSSGDADGALYQLTTYLAPEQEKTASAFQTSYSKRFHSEADIYAAQGYDAVRLIADAVVSGKLNAAGKPLVDLATFIKNPFASSTGPLYFDQADHSANRTLFLVQRTEKALRLVFKIEASQP